MSDESPDEIYGVRATASLWLLIPRIALGIVMSGLLITLAFYLQFGEINTYTFLLVIVAAGFQILVVVGTRFRRRTDLASTAKEGRFDIVGAFWLVAVLFGAMLGWFTADFANAYPNSAVAFHVATVVLTIVLPILTSLPNYRYVTTRNAHITLPLLIVVSLLPSAIGAASVIALYHAMTR